MFRITKSECENAINNAEKVNDQTIKLWKRCLKKIHKDFIFKSKEELEQQISELENTKDNNMLYKLQRDLRKTQQMLSKMFEVIESDPELLKHYKEVAKELERRQKENSNELEL